MALTAARDMRSILPAKAQLLLVTPQDRGSGFYSRFRQHVVKYNDLPKHRNTKTAGFSGGLLLGTSGPSCDTCKMTQWVRHGLRKTVRVDRASSCQAGNETSFYLIKK